MSKYNWAAEKRANLAEHSLVKHQIYAQYLKNYVVERTTRFGMENFRLNVVDGFCGGGAYTTSSGEKALGSPIVALNALYEAASEINAGRTKPINFDFRLLCYDKNQTALDRLRSELIEAGYEAEIDRTIHIQRSHFSQVAKRVVDRLHAEPGRTIFLLDQYGYGAVTFDTLKYIFSTLSQPEVILTFGYDWLANFVGTYESVCAKFNTLALPPPPYEEYLKACGGKFGVPFFIQRQLTREFRNVAQFFTPFFITSRDDGPLRGSNLKYWLVHLAQHERANDVMKRTHWGVHNHSAHFGGDGLQMLGYDAYQKGLAGQAHLFGEIDQARTHYALLEDIPKVLEPEAWVRVDSLWRNTCNETTSTSEMQRAALRALVEAKELEVLGPSGGSKRGLTVAKADLIRVPVQASFHFMKNPLPAHLHPSSPPFQNGR